MKIISNKWAVYEEIVGLGSLSIIILHNKRIEMYAERNAIANMITNGENKITKVLAIMPDGKVGPPCGACREFMMQLDKDSKEIDVLMDYDKLETMKLENLCPNWWTDRYLND